MDRGGGALETLGAASWYSWGRGEVSSKTRDKKDAHMRLLLILMPRARGAWGWLVGRLEYGGEGGVVGGGGQHHQRQEKGATYTRLFYLPNWEKRGGDGRWVVCRGVGG